MTGVSAMLMAGGMTTVLALSDEGVPDLPNLTAWAQGIP